MDNVSNYINIEPQTVGWLNTEMIEDRLFVDSSFQRRYVWKDEDKIKLIETILLGYTIPEIYLWEVGVNTTTGQTQKSIVDGQQRLMAIKQYLNNEYSLNEKYLEFKDQPYVNKKFEELSDADKKNIFAYKFSIRMIREIITRDQIIQIFNRLNSTSYDLTPQELRNAKFSGEFLELSTELADNSFWFKYDFFPGMQRRRMKDVEFVSNILMYYRQGIDEDLSQENLDRMYSLYENIYPEKQSDKQKFIATLNAIENLFIKTNNDKSIVNFVKKSTHLYTFFVLISFLQSKNLYNENTENHIIKFIKSYISDNNENEIIQQYKELSIEGTKSKINRMARFDLLLKYLNNK